MTPIYASGRYDPANIPAGLAYGVLGVLIATAPIQIGSLSVAPPWVCFAPAFALGVTRFTPLGALAAFTLGVMQDFLSGGAIGPWAAGMLAGFGVAGGRRESLNNAPWGVMWSVYVIAAGFAAATAYVTAWFALSVRGAPEIDTAAFSGLGEAIRSARLHPSLPAMMAQFLMTCALAPVLLAPLGGFDRLRKGAGGAP